MDNDQHAKADEVKETVTKQWFFGITEIIFSIFKQEHLIRQLREHSDHSKPIAFLKAITLWTIFFVGVACTSGYVLRDCLAAPQIAAIRDNLAKQQGVAKEQANQLQHKDEQIREKDNEILKLKIDQQKWQKWETFANGYITNAPQWEEKSDTLYKEVREILGSINRDKPELELLMNGVRITTNFATVEATNRELHMVLRNVGTIPALSSQILANITAVPEQLDLIDWTVSPLKIDYDLKTGRAQTNEVNDMFNTYQWTARDAILPYVNYFVGTVKVRSNYPNELLVMNVKFACQSANMKSYGVLVKFTTNAIQPHATLITTKRY